MTTPLHVAESIRPEVPLTRGPGGRILTNASVWSPDSAWIVFDARSDVAGAVFDGRRIELLHASSGEVRLAHESLHDSCCGVATFHPQRQEILLLQGPARPTPDWSYAPHHRHGLRVELSRPQAPSALDARNLSAPFTPGALRGGTHLHVWNPSGTRVSSTYHDALVEPLLRDVAVSVAGAPVRVPATHPRNHDGDSFTVLVTRATATPRPGSDDLARACEEAWVGREGYRRVDGSRQRHALAFQGQVLTARGEIITEVFVADLPEDLAVAGAGPLAGTLSERPFPPAGVGIRRLTHTAERKFPGVQGPRHWLQSSPDGARIAFLMKDENGVAQLFTISPNAENFTQVTRNVFSIASAFTWSPEGRRIAHALDGSVCVTEVETGVTTRLTARSTDALWPRAEAVVFSPDGTRIAFVKTLPSPDVVANQIFVVEAK